jgi:hypothetical protein
MAPQAKKKLPAKARTKKALVKKPELTNIVQPYDDGEVRQTTTTDSPLASAVRYEDPLYVSIRNISDVKKDFTLFGFNQFDETNNFGNDKEVFVKTFDDKNPYKSLVRSTSGTTFYIDRVRVQTDNVKNLDQSLFFNETDRLTRVFTRSFVVPSERLDKWQSQPNIIDFIKEFKLHQGAYVTGSILPNSTMYIAFYFKTNN